MWADCNLRKARRGDGGAMCEGARVGTGDDSLVGDEIVILLWHVLMDEEDGDGDDGDDDNYNYNNNKYNFNNEVLKSKIVNMTGEYNHSSIVIISYRVVPIVSHYCTARP